MTGESLGKLCEAGQSTCIGICSPPHETGYSETRNFLGGKGHHSEMILEKCISGTWPEWQQIRHGIVSKT